MRARITVEDQTFRFLTATNILKQSEFTRWLENDALVLVLLAQRPTLMQLTAELIQPDGSTAATNNLEELRNLQAYRDLLKVHLLPVSDTLGGFETLSIIRADDGLIMISTDDMFEGKYREHEVYFLEGKLHTYIDDVSYQPSIGKIALHISTPITDGTGAVQAVLVGHADLVEMSSIISQGNATYSSEDSYLVNSFNFFVTEPGYGKEISLTKAVHTEGVDACLAGEDGTGIYDDYRGVAVLGAFNWLPERRLCMLTEIDQDEAFAPIRQLQRTMISLSLAVALGTAGLAIYFSRTLTRPLGLLERTAKRIGQGDLGQRIEIETSDEIGDLAATFNEMAANLSSSIEMVDYGRKMMRALNHAGHELQRVHDEFQIYTTIVNTIEELGYDVVLMRPSEDKQELIITHITIASPLLAAAERLAGIRASEYRQSLQEDNTITQVYHSGIPAFAADMTELSTQSLNFLSRNGIGRIVDILGIASGIYAPITTEDHAFGLMVVLGKGLTENDLPAVGTFANQVAIVLENARLYHELEAWAKELESKVEERTELLTRSNQELEQFAYVASHDLQEPLRSVSGFLQLLERKHGADLDAEAVEFIQRAVKAAHRMQDLIQDLLQFSRVGTRGANPRAISSSVCLGDALSSLQHAIDLTSARVYM